MFKIYFKELLELSRDRKTLIFTILLPTLIMPVLFIGLGFISFTLTQEEAEKTLKFAIIGTENAPELQQRFALEKGMELKLPPNKNDIAPTIQQEKLDFVIEIPENFQSTLADGEQTQLTIFLNDASTTSQVYNRAKTVIERLNQELQSTYLSKLGIDKENHGGVLMPIKIIKENTAPPRENLGEKIGGFLPYILILVCLTGALYPALDLGVGEKERGTLETLLLSPISRFKIVLAKFLVLFSTSFIAVFFTILGMGIFFTIGIQLLSSQGLNLGPVFAAIQTISTVDLALILAMLAPVAAIFAAVLLGISIYAKNFKEAHNYLSPMTIIAIVPVLISIMPGVSFNWKWAMVPITNVALAIKELLKGTIDYNMVSIIFISTSAIAGILLGLIVRAFNKESVLFRT